MDITLKLNGELIKYGLCHIYSNSALSTPVILSNGNGAGTNTITANANGVVQLTASNCPAYIYCRIESSPSYVNSANFRLKTGAISGYSASASAKTIDMGFNSSNIFIPTDAKCAIGYDLLTLGYRYSLNKISPSSFPTETATANMFLYNKAFTYKAINSLDKTSYGSTTTQQTFGTYSSMNITNMLNTTRGVNINNSYITKQLSGSHYSGYPLKTTNEYGDYYTISDVSVNIAGYTISDSKVISDKTITPSVDANGAYILTSHTTDVSGITSLRDKGTHMNYAYNSGWIPLTYFAVPNTSSLNEKNINNDAIANLSSPYNLILTYLYSGHNMSTNIVVSFCLCEIDESADWDDGYYKTLSFCNKYYSIQSQGYDYENDIYIPIAFELGKSFNDGTTNYNTPNSFCFKQNKKYALFVRVIFGVPGNFKYVKLAANISGSLDININIELPEKVITFKNVGKNPLVPVYLALVSNVNNSKLSYLKISYSNYSYTTGNSSGSLDSGKATSVLHWLNANPAKIGPGIVSYSDLYKSINISGGNNTTFNRTKKTTTYIAKATPAVSYNGFTTTNWYTTQSNTKSYTANAVFDISAITSTNIKYSINEVLSGKHKLTQIRVEVSS